MGSNLKATALNVHRSLCTPVEKVGSDFQPRLMKARSATERMRALGAFLEFWLGPRQKTYGVPAVQLRSRSLPGPLSWLYEFAGRWPVTSITGKGQLWRQQNGLRPPRAQPLPGTNALRTRSLFAIDVKDFGEADLRSSSPARSVLKNQRFTNKLANGLTVIEKYSRSLESADLAESPQGDRTPLELELLLPPARRIVRPAWSYCGILETFRRVADGSFSVRTERIPIKLRRVRIF